MPDDVAIVAKLEKPAALDCLEEIVEISDAIMVARGDLGVELAPEDVPAAQKRIVHAARDRRQARGDRDPDAGFDDDCAGAHPRRSLGRRDRGL